MYAKASSISCRTTPISRVSIRGSTIQKLFTQIYSIKIFLNWCKFLFSPPIAFEQMENFNSGVITTIFFYYCDLVYNLIQCLAFARSCCFSIFCKSYFIYFFIDFIKVLFNLFSCDFSFYAFSTMEHQWNCMYVYLYSLNRLHLGVHIETRYNISTIDVTKSKCCRIISVTCEPDLVIIKMVYTICLYKFPHSHCNKKGLPVYGQL